MNSFPSGDRTASLALLPRFLRLRDAPRYLGMDKNRFNADVRPWVPSFRIGAQGIAFEPGQTVMQAALAADRYIPHLCYHPEFKPHGSCKLCTVKVGGWHATSCTLPAKAGLVVESQTEEVNAERRMLVQLLFVEGNHFCPSCEMSGHCKLQATAYDLGMTTPRFDHFVE